MASKMNKVVELCKATVTLSKPVLQKMAYYGKVELAPPKISDIPAIKNGIQNLVQSAKSGKYKEVTVREAWLNTLVTIEVLCWFFIGECIGKRHIVGYDV
ncbi:ATP synthase F(0) complex subunit g, mitochondrial [Nomia melanderi]|uniref:ATP synthase F(0) complex subunit g, mitochondrial n=1 Tax=Nomia melanderi TaxID=2448451 RepID=UPI00130403AA|nr:ATP synthase subunit g, mitochondrial-like [Nomia melanderi]